MLVTGRRREARVSCPHQVSREQRGRHRGRDGAADASDRARHAHGRASRRGRDRQGEDHVLDSEGSAVPGAEHREHQKDAVSSGWVRAFA